MSVSVGWDPGKTLPNPIPRAFAPAIQEVKCINLALQGGSAHGAFTWGVLDRFLEKPRIELEGVSATSAGAMNAAVMAHGLTTGGRKGAREALEEFWHSVARVSAPSGALQLFEMVSRFFSPYQVNPFNYNPLPDADICLSLLDHLVGSRASVRRMTLMPSATARRGEHRLGRSTVYNGIILERQLSFRRRRGNAPPRRDEIHLNVAS